MLWTVVGLARRLKWTCPFRQPFEQIINNLDSGSRSEFRRSMGIEVDEESQQINIGFPSCEYDDDDDELIVDGEVVEFEQQDDGQPFTPDDQDRGSSFDSEPGTGVFGPSGPPPNQGMVPLADAVTQAADMRRHAVLRPITRALPRADHEI
jgi:hypothetical protein